MKDWFDEQKKAARAQEMLEAEANKKALIREIKSGLGKQMVEELEQIKPPTRRQLLWKRIKKIFGI